MGVRVLLDSTEKLRTAPASELRVGGSSEFGEMHLRFRGAMDALHYLRSLASLLFGGSRKVTATSPAGVAREDLNTREIADRLERGSIEKLRFVLDVEGRPLVVEVCLLQSQSAVVIRAPFKTASTRAPLWLQCDPDVITPVPSLMLPTTMEGLTFDAAHALVVVTHLERGEALLAHVHRGDRHLVAALATDETARRRVGEGSIAPDVASAPGIVDSMQAEVRRHLAFGALRVVLLGE